VIEPLRLAFEVECEVDQAFVLWTERASLWWPHRGTRRGRTQVIFEPILGGRIFERDLDGDEVEWGSVLAWEPPDRLIYRWHIFSDASSGTVVEVRFEDQGNGTTRVDIEHRGWEAFADGEERRANNEAGWRGLVVNFQEACRRGSA
jgi:uncharacterized protein YndB with AHSA1/START domain